MSFGSTPDTWLYEIFFSLGALAAIILIALIGGLLQRILRIKADYFTLIFVIVVSIGTALGLSLYLDMTGQVAEATVTKKLETIHYREEGDWTHQYEVWATYPLPDGSRPSAHFSTTAPIFDSMQEGSRVSVRSASINHWFNLVRFADQSTWTWLPWRWLKIGLEVLIAGIIAWRLFKVSGGWLLVVVMLLLLGTIPFVQKYNEWRAAADPSRTPLHASGMIQEVEEVTTIDPFPGDSSDGDEWETSMDVAQRYAIVTVRYTPQGYVEPILGVDAVDIDETTAPLLVDQAVDIAYAASDPRAVQLPAHTRNHYIRNPLAWLRDQALALGLFVAITFLLSWVGNRWQRFLDSRHAAALAVNRHLR